MRRSIVAALVLVLLAPAALWAEGQLSICSEPTGGACAPVYTNFVGLVMYYVVYLGGPPISRIQFTIPPMPTECDGVPPIRIRDEAVFPNTVGDSETGVVVDFGECLSPPIHVLSLAYFFTGSEILYEDCCPWPMENVDAVSCGEPISWTSTTAYLSDEACHTLVAPHSPSPPDGATAVQYPSLYWAYGPEPAGCWPNDRYMFILSWGTDPDSLQTWSGAIRGVPMYFEPNTRYYWKVASSSANGAAPYWSPLWTFTTEEGVPVETTTWGRIKALYE